MLPFACTARFGIGKVAAEKDRRTKTFVSHCEGICVSLAASRGIQLAATFSALLRVGISERDNYRKSSSWAAFWQ